MTTHGPDACGRRIQHFDRWTVEIRKDSMREVGGQFEVDGVATREGVLVYHDSQGAEFLELRPAGQVFDPASMASLVGAPVTVTHPSGLVNGQTFGGVTHGAVKANRRIEVADGDDQMGVTLRLGTDEALAAIRGGTVELSPGYETDVVTPQAALEAGIIDSLEHRGQTFDGVQTNIEYNHLALVDEARAGPQARLHLDSHPDVRVQYVATGRSNMKHGIITIDGKTRKVALDQAKALCKMRFDGVNLDQIETGRMLIEIEGEEPVDMTLPKALIESMLEGVGIGMAAAAPAAEEPLAEVVEEGMDAGPEKEVGMDSIRATVRREVKRMFATRANADAKGAELRRVAAEVLPDGYDYSVSWQQVACDAVTLGTLDAGEQRLIQSLAKASSGGDLEAGGRLRQMVFDAAKLKRTAVVTTKAVPKEDGTDTETKPAWSADQPPPPEGVN